MTPIADWPLLLQTHAVLARFPAPVTLTTLHSFSGGHFSHNPVPEVQQALDELVRLGWAAAEDRTEPWRHGSKRMKTWTYYTLTMKGKSMTYPCPRLPRSLRTGGTFAMWTIYRKVGDLPWDPPWYTVLHWPPRSGQDSDARRPDLTPLYAGPNLHDAHCAVPDGADTCLHRCHDDDPSIVETWI